MAGQLNCANEPYNFEGTVTTFDAIWHLFQPAAFNQNPSHFILHCPGPLSPTLNACFQVQRKEKG